MAKPDAMAILVEIVEPRFERQAEFMRGYQCDAEAGWSAGVLSLTLPPKEPSTERASLSYQVDDDAILETTRLSVGNESVQRIDPVEVDPGYVTRERLSRDARTGPLCRVPRL